jgi:hypothetical protein
MAGIGDTIRQLESELQRVQGEASKISDALKALKGVAGKSRAAAPAKRKISAAGIARIRAAQKARWAKVRAAQKQGK